jgi:phage gpG-like protein
VPYAAIQEFGGKTAAHDIVAVKAKALAFSTGGDQVFARSVHHPGSTIPARSYLGGSLAEMHDEIESGFKEAILEALGQG